jgi:putative SOS response-associated peptidase YedK
MDPDTGKLALSFTIITTRSNGLMKPIHDRMPGIYDDIMARHWLTSRFGNRPMELNLALQPLPQNERPVTTVPSRLLAGQSRGTDIPVRIFLILFFNPRGMSDP